MSEYNRLYQICLNVGMNHKETKTLIDNVIKNKTNYCENCSIVETLRKDNELLKKEQYFYSVVKL